MKALEGKDMETTIWYPINSPFGGAYIHLLNNVIAAKLAGFKVNVIPTDRSLIEHLNKDLETLGFEGDVKYGKGGLTYVRPESLIFTIKLLKMKVDVIEMNSMPLWLSGQDISTLRDLRNYFYSIISDTIHRIVMHKMPKIITISEVSAQLLWRDAFLRAESVPNQPLPNFGKLVSKPKEYTICFPSSYYYSYQGFDKFIKAVQELGIEDKVILIGKVPPNCKIRNLQAKGIKELAKAYSLCSAFVSPHRDTTPVPFFGSPTKVVDALATNKALIVSDLKSIRETVEKNLKKVPKDCIIWIKPGSVEDLKEALMRILKERPYCEYELAEGTINSFWRRLSEEVRD